MIFSGSDVIGDGVNIASRLQEDAEEGCINISSNVYSNVRNKADILTNVITSYSIHYTKLYEWRHWKDT